MNESDQRILKDQFFDYLVSLNLFRVKIWTDESSVKALVTTIPSKTNFTNTYNKVKDTGCYEVRLSFKDLKNPYITNGFFD